MLPFRRGVASVSRGRRRPRGAAHDPAEVVQASRPRAHGEDRRELHRRARDAARRRRAEGLRRAGAHDVRRGDPPQDRARLGGVVRPARRRGAPPSCRTPRSRAGSREEEGVDGWWSQSVTVSYERARGMRAVGERPDGFSVTAQKTVAVPVERLYDAFVDRRRARAGCPAREAARAHRHEAEVGPLRLGRRLVARLVVGFTARGEAKSTVALEHERLARRRRGRADEARSGATACAALAAQLEPAGTVTSRDGTRIAFERAGTGRRSCSWTGRCACARSGRPAPLAAARAGPHRLPLRPPRARRERRHAAVRRRARGRGPRGGGRARPAARVRVRHVLRRGARAARPRRAGCRWRGSCSTSRRCRPPAPAEGDVRARGSSSWSRAGRRGDAVEFFLDERRRARRRRSPRMRARAHVAAVRVGGADARLRQRRAGRRHRALRARRGGHDPDARRARIRQPGLLRRGRAGDGRRDPGRAAPHARGPELGPVEPDGARAVLREFFA